MSSYVITGDHERNWLLAEAAGAPDSFTFSLPSHIILAEFIHQLRRYGNADQINRWLAQFERDNASLMIKIAQTITAWWFRVCWFLLLLLLKTFVE